MTALPEPSEPFRRGPEGGRPAEDDPRRCTAHRTDGTGRCNGWSVPGSNVCRFHGGSAPQAKRKAQLRLLDMIPLATKRHREILRDTKDERVALQAVKMVYDRTGLEEGSASGDVDVVRQMVATRLVDLIAGGSAEETDEELGETDDDIVDAEIVEEEDPEGWDLL